jgi:agmatine/peptidylarginine deiminase
MWFIACLIVLFVGVDVVLKASLQQGKTISSNPDADLTWLGGLSMAEQKFARLIQAITCAHPCGLRVTGTHMTTYADNNIMAVESRLCNWSLQRKFSLASFSLF